MSKRREPDPTSPADAAMATALTPMQLEIVEQVRGRLALRDRPAQISELVRSTYGIMNDSACPDRYLRGGAILSAEVGSGKTIVALRIVVEMTTGGCRCGCGRARPRVLVLCPTSLVGNWRAEIAKHVRPGVLRVGEYGTAPAGKKRELDREADVVLATIHRPQLDLATALPVVGEALLSTSATERHARAQAKALPGMSAAVDDRALTVERAFASKAGTLYSERWCLVVVDEAHELRSVQGPRSRAICAYLPCANLLYLTGTPIQNGESDLFAPLLALRDPELLAQRIMDRRTLSALAKPWTITRRFKQMLAENPRLIDENPILSFLEQPRVFTKIARRLESPEERAMHASTVARLRTVLELLGPEASAAVVALDSAEDDDEEEEASASSSSSDGGPVEPADRARAALELLLRARQICIAPCLAAPRLWNSPLAQHNVGSTKMRAICEFFERVGPSELLSDDPSRRTKLIVFCQFTRALDLIARVLDEKLGGRYRYLQLTGKTRKRDEVKRRFCEDRDVHVLLAQTRVGGYGHTLVQAARVLIVDPWWNPAVDDQAAARIYRIGQTRPVIVTRLLAAGTVDEFVSELAEAKRRCAQAFDAATGGGGEAPPLAKRGRPAAAGRGGGPTLDDIRRGLRRLETVEYGDVDDEQERLAAQVSLIAYQRIERFARAACEEDGARSPLMAAALAAASPNGCAPAGSLFWSVAGHRGDGSAAMHDSWLLCVDAALDAHVEAIAAGDLDAAPPRCALLRWAAPAPTPLPLAGLAPADACFLRMPRAPSGLNSVRSSLAALPGEALRLGLLAALAGLIDAPLARAHAFSSAARSDAARRALSPPPEALSDRELARSFADRICVDRDGERGGDLEGPPRLGSDGRDDYFSFASRFILPPECAAGAALAAVAFYLAPVPACRDGVPLGRDRYFVARGLEASGAWAAVARRTDRLATIVALGSKGSSFEATKAAAEWLHRFDREAAAVPLVVLAAGDGGGLQASIEGREALPDEEAHRLAREAASDPLLPPLGSLRELTAQPPDGGCPPACPCRWASRAAGDGRPSVRWYGPRSAEPRE